jgi:hypothetical protein
MSLRQEQDGVGATHPSIRISRGSRHQAAQDEVRSQRGRHFDEIEVVLQHQWIDEGPQRQVDRLDRLVQRRPALELTGLAPFADNVGDKALDLRIVTLRTWPVLTRCKRGNVVEFAIVEEQIHTRGDHGFHQATETLGWRQVFFVDRLLDRRNDLAQAVRADGFANRLFGIEEFVDVRLGETDGLGQIGHRGLGVAVLAEMLVGRRDNLITNVVIDGTTRAGEGWGN